MKGILDRFEGEQAVILIEEANDEWIVDKKDLPAGSEKNTIFKLTKTNGTYRIVKIDEKATNVASETSSSLMEKLRAKSKGSKFKR